MVLWHMKFCEKILVKITMQMEFLVISVFDIIKWLFPTKFESVLLPHVLFDSVINLSRY